MSDFKNVAQEIIDAVGGLDNISAAHHCMTRLRLEIKNQDLVNDDVVKAIDKVKGVINSSGQYQIILGTGVVNKVYKEVEAIFSQNDKGVGVQKGGGNMIQKVSRLFGDIFIPIIPVIIVSGILMGVRTFLVSSGYLVAGTPWYQVLAVLIDTGFAFLPALVGYSAAKKFGGNPIYGFVIGLMMISSTLPSGGAIGRGNAEALEVAIFGLFTLPVRGYQGSILIAMAGGYLVTKIETLVRKFVPNVIDMILTPILTIGLAYFAIIFVLGPIIQVFETGLVSMFMMVLNLPFGIGGFITAALQQVLVITGMHHGLWIIDISMLEVGLNFYQPIRNASMLGQAGAVIAFAIFARNKELKANSAASSVSALFGITEPAIFGSTLAYGMPFIFGCIGAGFAGMYATIVGLGAPGMGAGCIPGILYFLGDTTALTHYLVSSAIAIGVAFTLTTIFLKKRDI